MSADQLEDTVMNTDKRTLKQITIDNLDECGVVVRNLMGSSAALRKAFIEKNADKARIDS